MKCPKLVRTLVVADDARLAAQASCALAMRGCYVPVVDGPRMNMPSREADLVRRNNAAASVNASSVVFAGLPGDAAEAMLKYFPAKLVTRVSTPACIKGLPVANDSSQKPSLIWGRDRVGIGLLKALRLNTGIEFNDTSSPADVIPSKSNHLVVCEEGDDLAEVIAANYAFALGAGLQVIPEVDRAESQSILERFYSLYDRTNAAQSQSAILKSLQDHINGLLGKLEVPLGGSITFITERLPYGFGRRDVPSTHLFRIPGLGLSVINGFAAEQRHTKGVNVAVLVDPSEVDAPEIAAANKLLPERRIFVRGYRGAGANVADVAQMVELFPYDLLLIATHCGDAPGYRMTYQFCDSEGLNRTLVLDTAIGVGRPDRDDMFHVAEFMYIRSLDGVDWHDEGAKKGLYVGTALKTFFETKRLHEKIEPISKVAIERVPQSSALKMHDGVYIPIPNSLASDGSPIIINNACTSWHRLAETFVSGGARSYTGTLFQVSTSEAHDVAVGILGKHFGKPLPTALWATQRKIYGDNPRWPYVMTGVYPQRLRATPRDVPKEIMSDLARGVNSWRTEINKSAINDAAELKHAKKSLVFFERELEGFKRRWLK